MKHPLLVTLSELPALIILTCTYVFGVGLAALMLLAVRLWVRSPQGWEMPRKGSSLTSLH
ncbi:MAG: hypothetical protein KBE09_03455 [Candidatus Pacebacteria bacterium]|nr:hypothetical protein [Candidatus Paceibacterota bacterium]